MNESRDGGMHRALVLAAMSVSQAMILLDVTIVNVGLPAIQRDLSAPPGSLEWVISAYSLVLAALIPLGGTLGDRFGRKRIFIGGLSVFTLSSAACALSDSGALLIAFRACQGLGGAAMAALTLSILAEAYPPERRGRAIGIWASVGGLGFGLGPVAGGILLSQFDWSSIFWVNVPVGVIGIMVAALVVHESRDQAQRPFDLLGVCLCGAGLFGVTLGLIQSSSAGWGSVSVIAPIAAGVVLLAGFALWERRVSSPMIPPSLLRARGFTRASVVFLLVYASQAALMFYVTLLFQDVKDWSPLRTGLSWLFMNVPFFMIATMAGSLGRRFRAQMLIALGCLIAGVGTLLLGLITVTTPFALTAVCYVLYGVGCGLVIPFVAGTAMGNVPRGASGIASGTLNASRQVGTSVGLAVLGSVGISATSSMWHAKTGNFSHAAVQGLTHDVTGGQLQAVAARLGPDALHVAQASFVHGYRVAIIVSAVVLLVACATAYAGVRAPRRVQEGTEERKVPAQNVE
jgi:EmrB/QacA subfamily drug resistance transporter